MGLLNKPKVRVTSTTTYVKEGKLSPLSKLKGHVRKMDWCFHPEPPWRRGSSPLQSGEIAFFVSRRLLENIFPRNNQH